MFSWLRLRRIVFEHTYDVPTIKKPLKHQFFKIKYERISSTITPRSMNLKNIGWKPPKIHNQTKQIFCKNLRYRLLPSTAFNNTGASRTFANEETSGQHHPYTKALAWALSLRRKAGMKSRHLLKPIWIFLCLLVISFFLFIKKHGKRHVWLLHSLTGKNKANSTQTNTANSTPQYARRYNKGLIYSLIFEEENRTTNNNLLEIVLTEKHLE